jgi:hypothetical protein
MTPRKVWAMLATGAVAVVFSYLFGIGAGVILVKIWEVVR